MSDILTFFKSKTSVPSSPLSHASTTSFKKSKVSVISIAVKISLYYGVFLFSISDLALALIVISAMNISQAAAISGATEADKFNLGIESGNSSAISCFMNFYTLEIGNRCGIDYKVFPF